LRVTAAELLEHLQREGITAKATTNGSVVIAHSMPIIRTTAFIEGLLQPQDPTSMEVVRHMGLSPGQTVLDLCAGLGTKSTQMAEMMRNQGVVLASDIDESKLSMLSANCQRLGHTIVQTVSGDQVDESAKALPGLDWILIDAPCSNTGVLARRPEARYRLNERAFEKLAGLQLELLEQASKLAQPQTRMMYSTCSIDEQENEQLVATFVQSHPKWRPQKSRLTLPAAGNAAVEWRDGGYFAILVREM
jgi:16S rRNA (cytosine967-C5)-methyltransferase